MPYRDHPNNILGVNTASNAFSSSLVSVAKPTGSMIERIAHIQAMQTFKKVVTLAAADFTGTTTRFTITGGGIYVHHLILRITTAIPAGANTLKFSFTPTGGGATDLCGTTDTASAGAEQLFVVDGVKATALVKCTDVGIMVAANEHMPIALGTGVIQTIFSAGPPATGAGKIYLVYSLLDPTAAVA